MKTTWRIMIIPVSKWLVRGITLLRGLTDPGYYPLTKYPEPPSSWWFFTNPFTKKICAVVKLVSYKVGLHLDLVADSLMTYFFWEQKILKEMMMQSSKKKKL